MKRVLRLFLFCLSITAFAIPSKDSAPAVYREFLLTIFKADKDAAIKLTLPDPDLAKLFPTVGESPEHLKEATDQIHADPYRVLKNGETSTLPNGTTVSPTEQMEKKGWVIVANQSDPLPHMLKNVNGVWKVDAGDLIAAWKAAAKEAAKSPNKVQK
jgi:hypothetical protein